MTKLKASVYIDISNVYHSLKRSNILDVFEYKTLIDLLNQRYDIIKVYFYDATKSIKEEPHAYSKQQSYHQKLMKDIAQASIQTRKLRYHKLDGRIKDAGLIVLSKEKGIDVLLATDMIRDAFQNRWDVALLFTGDADFVPAVNLVQTLKKQVINVHLYEGSSSELRKECNSHLLIDIDKKGSMHLK